LFITNPLLFIFLVSVGAPPLTRTSAPVGCVFFFLGEKTGGVPVYILYPRDFSPSPTAFAIYPLP
jgi:hypothetical protein